MKMPGGPRRFDHRRSRRKGIPRALRTSGCWGSTRLREYPAAGVPGCGSTRLREYPAAGVLGRGCPRQREHPRACRPHLRDSA